MLPHFVHAQSDQIARKQFCQRRRDRLQQSCGCARCSDIRSPRSASREECLPGANLLRVKSRASASFSQRLMPPLLSCHRRRDRSPVCATRAGIRDPSRERMIESLIGIDALVVVPVQRPGLQLSAAETPFVHHQDEMDADGDSALRQRRASGRAVLQTKEGLRRQASRL